MTKRSRRQPGRCQRGHKIIAAGGLNVLYGYVEGGSQYWKARYDTVLSRTEALGLPLVGPCAGWSGGLRGGRVRREGRVPPGRGG